MKQILLFILLACLIISELKKRKNWKHDYFYQTPTIAAMTILKFQNDCEKSAAITLLDIYEYMNN